MNKYRVTRTYYKDVEIEANSPQEARELASCKCLFDDARLIASDVDEVETIGRCEYALEECDKDGIFVSQIDVFEDLSKVYEHLLNSKNTTNPLDDIIDKNLKVTLITYDENENEISAEKVMDSDELYTQVYLKGKESVENEEEIEL